MLHSAGYSRALPEWPPDHRADTEEKRSLQAACTNAKFLEKFAATAGDPPVGGNPQLLLLGVIHYPQLSYCVVPAFVRWRCFHELWDCEWPGNPHVGAARGSGRPQGHAQVLISAVRRDSGHPPAHIR